MNKNLFAVLLLLSTAVTAQNLPSRIRMNARQNSNIRVDRTSRINVSAGLAFFEAFPTSGAGAGLVAPLPNWVLQSQDFTTSWSLNFSAGKDGIFTADFATAPDGTFTANRLQLPQVTAPAEYTRIYAAGVAIPAGPFTCSFYIKGNGTTGAMPFILLSGTTQVLCSYTPSNWERCSASSTNVGGGENIYIGPTGIGTVTTLAQDVLIWGAMCNVGSTAAPYIATTTAAMGYTPTGAKGEVLTFTRASTAYATKTATGGLATTGIANGDLVLMPANQPRVEYDSNGTLGLLVESARTNSILRSQEITVASGAWTLLNSGIGDVTVTSDYGIAPDGTTTAERLQVPACAAVNSYSLVGQNYTATVATHGVSLYVRAVSGTPAISVCTVNGTGGNFCSACSATTSGWTRCASVNTVGVASIFYIGCNNVTSTYIGASNTGAADVLVWGAQSELGAYATSYIPTTTSALARAAETATFPGSVPITAGSSAESLTVTAASSLWYGLTWGGSAEGPYGIATDTRCYDGTTQVIQATTYLANVTKRQWCSWYGSSMIASDGVSSTSGAFDGTMGTGIPTLSVGNFGGANQVDGIVSRICVDPSSTRCR